MISLHKYFRSSSSLLYRNLRTSTSLTSISHHSTSSTHSHTSPSFSSSASSPSIKIARHEGGYDGKYFSIPLRQDKPITWYSCGPTVYDVAHLGHARTYVATDIIRRILTDYFHEDVQFAMGLTDVDDKIIKKFNEKKNEILLKYNNNINLSNENFLNLARFYENEFFKDLDDLNVKRPDVLLRVSEHIDEIVKYIEKLLQKGNAYVAADGIYFDLSSLNNDIKYDRFGLVPPQTDYNEEEEGTSDRFFDPNHVPASNTSPTTTPSINTSDKLTKTQEEFYQREEECLLNNTFSLPSHSLYKSFHNNYLNNNNTDNLIKLSSNERKTIKKNSKDFALWKFHPTTSPGWPTSLGYGRPGWHIECSALTYSFFGDVLDIHSGGIDLKFPHHTNEIAQSESHNECCGHGGEKRDWVKTWIHTGHLHIEGRKMSKSLKNFISIRDYFNQDYIQILESSSNSSSSSSSTTPTKVSLSAASDEFRLFCLLHQYDSPLTFSTDRILKDARGIRTKFISYFSLISSLKTLQSNDNLYLKQSRKPSNNTLNLLTKFSHEKEQIKLNLLNNFDTSSSINSLLNLINLSIEYLKLTTKEDNYNGINESYDILYSIHDYIYKMLTIFGLKFPYEINYIRNDNNNNNNYIELLELLLNYRTINRNNNIKIIKNIKILEKKLKKNDNDNDINQILLDCLKELLIYTNNSLESSDKIRDDLKYKHKIIVEDSLQGSIWRKDD